MGYAQGDGPRGYLFLPKDQNIVIPWYMNLSGNINPTGQVVLPDADVNTNVFLVNYHHTFGLGGRFGMFQFVLPGGGVTGKAQLGDQTVEARKSSGLSDAYVATTINIAGAPALAPREYVAYPFRASVSALFGVFMPTGSYDNTRLLNLGTNRWTFRFGAPIVVGIGEWQIGKRTTFEINPQVLVYTDNTDLAVGDSRSQDLLVVVESSLTRDLNRAMWVGATFRYFGGGETSVDGVPDDNRQNDVGVSGTFGMALSPSVSFQVSYGVRVSSHTEDFSARMFRFRVACVL